MILNLLLQWWGRLKKLKRSKKRKGKAQVRKKKVEKKGKGIENKEKIRVGKMKVGKGKVWKGKKQKEIVGNRKLGEGRQKGVRKGRVIFIITV